MPSKDQITSRGANDQGNRYDTRVDNSGNTGYHYSNQNNSYYYQNTNGSKYYNSGDGYAKYTSPKGNETQYTSKSENSGKK